MKIFFLILPFTFLLLSCSSQNIDDYKNEIPKLDIREFFKGPLVAYGTVQSFSGKVEKRFTVEMIGTWKGNTGTLDEDFTYSDGTKQKRIWKLVVEGQNVKGFASDVLGTAHGRVLGNTFKLDYDLRVDVDGSEYIFSMKDWMYLIDCNTMIAKTKMNKYGITVGEVTLVMQKK